jgi:putative spermidine/putrescine transport system substrate-binding protein
MRKPAILAMALLATTALAGAMLAGVADAQAKTLYVAAYGGSFEDVMRKQVFPPFEKKYRVTVEYVAGNSTDNLAKLQAQKGSEQIDVAVLDDGPMYQAVALGFCAPLAQAPIFHDLYDVAAFPSGRAVSIGVVGTGIMYNSKYFADHHWAAPSSWKDLEDPKYKKKLVIPPLNNSYGLHALVMTARVNGGGEKDIDPGFTVFKQKIDPNVLVYEPSPGKMTELFQTNQAVIAIWGSGREKALAATGFPVDFVYPKEGGVALGVAACPVAGAGDKPEAQEFVQFLLTPEMQAVLAQGAGLGPVNKTVTLPPDQQAGIPYGPAQVDKLQKIDWDTVNAHREEWNRRWTREIESGG